jgi:putative acetyltransferase
MEVRSFRDTDAAALAQIFFSAVHELASAHYSPEQIKAWAPGVPDAEQFARRAADGRTVLVALGVGGKPIAYGDIERNGHIDHLYCSPEAAGRGVAQRLYQELERLARSEGVAVLSVEASEPAKRFFRKQGFEVICRNDFELGGVPIHNFAMRKSLA